MPVIINGTTGITTPTYNGSIASEYLVPVTGFKNRLINGDMTIDQRNNGASVTANDNIYPVDRFRIVATQTSKGTAQRNAGSVTPPAGFTNYLGFTSTSAYSVTASDQFAITQTIEGVNVADLGWGTANAQTVTLSFWVRSSLTGAFGGALRNTAATRSYPFSYTINSANTWEQKSVTIAGDTTGTWATDTSIGIWVMWGLGVGSTASGTAGAWASSNFVAPTGATSVVGTNGATFYITGVQLEKGSNATSFDYLPFGTELQLCQRYYQFLGGAVQSLYADGYSVGTNLTLPCNNLQTMRASPTAATAGTWTTLNVASQTYATGTTSTTVIFSAVGSGVRLVGYNNASSGFTLSAEL
jgi:hypothetical protein